MRILIINTSDSSGGAAVAARRLLHALRASGAEADMLVQKVPRPERHIHQYRPGSLGERLAYLRFIGERLLFLPFEKNKKLRFAFSPASTGVNIAAHPLVQRADVIHLHWVNGGFISLSGLADLFALGKPIIWTLHDMWPFTGGCHYSGDCDHYLQSCGNCPMLRIPSPKDLSYQINQKKGIGYDTDRLYVVGCSNWMANLASESRLFSSADVSSIPNPIDLEVFKPLPMKEAKERLGLDVKKRHILFGAMNTQDERKGFKWLKQALEILSAKEGSRLNDIELLVFGKADEEVFTQLPFKVNYIGQIYDTAKLVAAYSAADIMVTPSVQDNLPNTIMEALACGTPVVAFEVGGVPEMIIHKQTGYLARLYSAEDLAKGIFETLETACLPETGDVCRDFTKENYSYIKIAAQYRSLYERALVAMQ